MPIPVVILYITICVKLDTHFFTVNVGCLKKVLIQALVICFFCLFVVWPLNVGFILFVLTVVVIFIR